MKLQQILENDETRDQNKITPCYVSPGDDQTIVYGRDREGHWYEMLINMPQREDEDENDYRLRIIDYVIDQSRGRDIPWTSIFDHLVKMYKIWANRSNQPLNQEKLIADYKTTVQELEASAREFAAVVRDRVKDAGQ